MIMARRILYWTARFWPHIGGVEVLALHLIPALEARGMDVQVITSHGDARLPDDDRIDGIPIRRFDFLPSLTRRDLAGMARARRGLADLKRTFRPDLVHIHLSGPESLFHWQTQRAHPAPTLVTVHAIPNDLRSRDSLLARTLRSATWVTTVSAVMLERLRHLVPEIEDRSSVVYNGIAEPAEAIAPLPVDPPIFLCLGRLVAWKGFDVAVTAFARLLEEFPRTRLIVAGDGPERAGLEARAKALGIRSAVEFRGWVPPERVVHCINESSVVVIPSRRDENLPMVAIQAAQMARPVIASNVSGLPEIVEDGKTGLLVEPDQLEALAAAMGSVARDGEEARRLGLANRQRAAGRFNLAGCADAYCDLYGRLFERVTAGPHGGYPG